MGGVIIQQIRAPKRRRGPFEEDGWIKEDYAFQPF